jgi:hypothetical protein
MPFKLGDFVTNQTISVYPCWRKHQWATRADAIAHLSDILKHHVAKDVSRINVFECQHCGFWHVGHSRTMKERAI